MKSKIVVWKDGSYKHILDGVTFEYEEDQNWLATIPLEKEMGEEVRYTLIQKEIQNLTGKVLTLLEATVDDERKLTAVKDIVKEYFSSNIKKIHNFFYDL